MQSAPREIKHVPIIGSHHAQLLPAHGAGANLPTLISGQTFAVSSMISSFLPPVWAAASISAVFLQKLLKNNRTGKQFAQKPLILVSFENARDFLRQLCQLLPTHTPHLLSSAPRRFWFTPPPAPEPGPAVGCSARWGSLIMGKPPFCS